MGRNAQRRRIAAGKTPKTYQTSQGEKVLPPEERDPVAQRRRRKAVLTMLGARAWIGR